MKHPDRNEFEEQWEYDEAIEEFYDYQESLADRAYDDRVQEELDNA